MKWIFQHLVAFYGSRNLQKPWHCAYFHLTRETSHSVRHGHIPRWWFLYKKMNALSSLGEYDFLQPDEYRWDIMDDELQPQKHVKLLHDELVVTCNCTSGCANKRCKCLSTGFSCTQLFTSNECVNNDTAKKIQWHMINKFAC